MLSIKYIFPFEKKIVTIRIFLCLRGSRSRRRQLDFVDSNNGDDDGANNGHEDSDDDDNNEQPTD